MKKLFILLASLLIFFGGLQVSDARSGCCSHHGGVCGCGCCDGSSLSATCAPYYPNCGQANVSQTITAPPTDTPKVTIPSQNRISEFNQALTYTQSLRSTYLQYPGGFREKLVSEMLNKFTTLKLDNIGLIVYSTLLDVK